MNKRFAFTGFLAGLAVVVVLGGLHAPGFAATSGETVKLRQETMKKMGGHMKAIKLFLEKGEGSASDVAARAASINEISTKIPGLFPEGTSMDQVKDPETGAKPDIWADWEKFLAAAKGLGSRSATLKVAADGGDKGAIGAAFGAMGKNGCGGCHKPFRQKREKK